MQVRLTRAASREIDALIRLGARKFGIPTAREHYEGLVQILDLLGDAPKISPEIGRGVRVHSYRSHIIVYREQDGGIEVLRIRHGMSNWKKFL